MCPSSDATDVRDGLFGGISDGISRGSQQELLLFLCGRLGPPLLEGVDGGWVELNLLFLFGFRGAGPPLLDSADALGSRLIQPAGGWN